MSKLKEIIALEEQLQQGLLEAKQDASVMIDEARKKAEQEIASFRLDLDKEIKKLNDKESKEVKALESKLLADKKELNNKIEERFEQIVVKYVALLKDEVTKL